MKGKGSGILSAMWIFIWMVLSLVFSPGISTGTASEVSKAPALPEVSELIQVAEGKRLDEERLWWLLLHVESGLFGPESRADGPAFFFAPEGVDNPRQELHANIAALLAPPGEDPDKHYRCRFPARTGFLMEGLELTEAQLPPLTCAKLKKFREDFRARSISLMYATANMDEPASMFGHTMLLFGQDDDEPMDDYVTSYVAMVTHSGFARIYRGAFGGFGSVVEVANLAQRLLTYNTRESRNLWSFKLNLRQEQVDRIIDHLWEMKSTYFAYYYMDENCSFYNQHFLQVGVPDYNIDNMGEFALPIEAVQLVLQYPELVKEVSFYPAAKAVVRGGYEQLPPEEHTLVEELIRSPRALSSPNASVLYKTALHAHWVRAYADGENELTEEEQTIADELRKLMIQSGKDPVLTQPDGSNPTIGHGPHTVRLGGGFGQGGGGSGHYNSSEYGGFGIIGFRPLLHTLRDNPLSYSPYSEIQFMASDWRTRLNGLEFWLDQATVASVYSINRWQYGVYPKSWNLEVGARHLYREGLPSYATYVHGQWGLSLPLGNLGSFSLFGGPALEWTPALKWGHRIGAQTESVLLLYLHDRWTFSGRGGVRTYASPWWSWVPYGEGALSLYVGNYFSLEAVGRYLHAPSSLEGMGVLQFHFY